MPVFEVCVNKKEAPDGPCGQKAEEVFQIEYLCAKKNPLESIGKLLEVCGIV